MNSNFGKISVLLLLLLGAALLLSGKRLRSHEVLLRTTVASARPYMSGAKERQLLLIPLEQKGLLAMPDEFALATAGPQRLLASVQPGDTLQLGLAAPDAAIFDGNANGLHLRFQTLQVNGQAIIALADYNRTLAGNSQMGWWVLALGLSMVPYFFISRPRVHPGWVFAGVLLAMLTWLLW
jgi:hypothetical protein